MNDVCKLGKRTSEKWNLARFCFRYDAGTPEMNDRQGVKETGVRSQRQDRGILSQSFSTLNLQMIKTSAKEHHPHYPAHHHAQISVSIGTQFSKIFNVTSIN